MALRNRAVLLHELGRREEEIEAWRQVLVLGGEDADVLGRLYTLLGREQRHEEALAATDRYLALRPNDALACSFSGVILRRLSRHRDSIAAQDAALARDPKLVVALNRRGAVFYDCLREFGRALADFDRALTIDPEDLWANRNRGIALMSLGRLPEALTAFDRCLELSTGDVYARVTRAGVLRKMQRLEDALAEIGKAGAEGRHVGEQEAERAYVLALLGRSEEARAALEKPIAAEGAEADELRVRAAWLLGEDEKALGEATRLWKEKPGCYGHLPVVALRRLDRTEEAAALAKELPAAERLPQLELESALLAAVAGRADEARRWLEARELPWDPESLLLGARVQIVLEDREQARAWICRTAERTCPARAGSVSFFRRVDRARDAGKSRAALRGADGADTGS